MKSEIIESPRVKLEVIKIELDVQKKKKLNGHVKEILNASILSQISVYFVKWPFPLDLSQKAN